MRTETILTFPPHAPTTHEDADLLDLPGRTRELADDELPDLELSDRGLAVLLLLNEPAEVDEATTPTTIPAAEAKVAMVQRRVREWRPNPQGPRPAAEAAEGRRRPAERGNPASLVKARAVAAANRSRRDNFTASLPGGGKPFDAAGPKPPPLMPGERRMPELDALFL